MTARRNFLTIAFADLGSTSRWLVPTHYAQEALKINPKTFWQYREGSSQPANEIGVQEGPVDSATDYDRNRSAMISSDRIKQRH